MCIATLFVFSSLEASAMSKTNDAVSWEETRAKTLAVMSDPQTWSQMGCDELLHTLFPGLIIYATSSEESLIGALLPMYRKSMEICPSETRLRFYGEFRDFLFDLPPVPNGFMPFLVLEDYRPIAAEAAIDFSMMAGLPSDGVKPVTQLLGLIESGTVENRGAVFGGLIFLADERVRELIWGHRDTLTDQEVDEAARSRTVYPNVAAFEFWLDWAEELARNGDTNSARFGSVISAMAMILRDEAVGTFNYIERNFGYMHAKEYERGQQDSVPEMTIKKSMPIEDYGRSIADRLFRLEAIEEPPKLISDVILRFGMTPRAKESEQYRDAIR
jgi:hypothetical protein